jgi:pyruvate dehydrogenase E2 component (dihydrolipoamide acetyltransferase)
MADFVMPSLGADMETAKVVQWLVAPGSRVKPGDVVAVVETHKGAIDVEIFLEGVIDQLAPLDHQLPVGAVLAHVRESGAAATPKPAPSPAPAPAPAPLPAPSAVAARRAQVSPAARRRAQQLGIDADSLQGSGAGGSVTLADVERAGAQHAAAPAATPAPTQPVRAGGFDPAQMRAAIAAAMSRSKREIPHYYLGSAIDFSAAASWLAAFNSDKEPAQRLLPAALLLKATALALRAAPQLNGFYENGGWRAGAGIHIGWAIALRGGGLVAPALHHADRMSLPQLMAALRDLVQRARAGGLRSSELTDPTITVTSLGERGADSVLGIIYPPQVAIVGFGRIVERPWVAGGAVVVRQVLEASLAADHRASDGHVGGQLLAAIDEALQKPEAL